MLFRITSSIDFIGLTLALWLALYLLGRGFPSRITLRAVIVLLATVAFFLCASINLYSTLPGAGLLEALLVTLSLALWCDLTDIIFLAGPQAKSRRLVSGMYWFALLTMALLLKEGRVFIEEAGQGLWVQRSALNLAYFVYCIFILASGLVVLYNVRSGIQARAGTQNRYFLITTLLVFNVVGIAGLNLAFGPPLPRVIEDTLVSLNVVLLGVSVARHQTLVERRTTAQDFLISITATFGLSAIYGWLTWQISHSPILLILATSLAILTHAAYDLVREFLNLLRHRSESKFRAQLHHLEKNFQGELSLENRLQDGIELLCRSLDASGGFIALQREKNFIVCASHHSLHAGTVIAAQDLLCEDLCKPEGELARRIAWLAPAFERGSQVAVIGLGPSKTRFQYSNDDLDLLAEAADRIGTIVYLSNLEPRETDRLLEIVSDFQTREASLRQESDELLTTLVSKPDPEFVQMVEDGLRHLSDFVSPGQFPLSENLGVPGETVIERGKAVQQQLIRAVEMLRPDKLRPEEPLPREWYGYVVLHDAYIEEVPNRQIMARLYISEGTFNRTRRNALRGVARLLLEKRARLSGPAI